MGCFVANAPRNDGGFYQLKLSLTGRSGTPRPLDSSRASLEHWIHLPAFAEMTTENVARARIYQTQFRDLAACFARGIHLFPALSNQRAQGMPGARCARSRACSVESTRAPQVTGKHPAFPAQWF